METNDKTRGGERKPIANAWRRRHGDSSINVVNTTHDGIEIEQRKKERKKRGAETKTTLAVFIHAVVG